MVDAPLPSKPLPSARKLAGKMFDLPTANLINIITGRAKTNEKMATASRNLKGTFKKLLRGRLQAVSTELAK